MTTLFDELKWRGIVYDATDGLFTVSLILAAR